DRSSAADLKFLHHMPQAPLGTSNRKTALESMADLTRISGTVDFDEIAAFQRRAFGDEWLKSERRRLQRAEYYRWKYFPPAGPAWLASIRSGHDMAAMAAAVPFHAAGADGASTAWQICDIAVDPGFRRRGLFARCLAALATAVAGDT